MAWVHQVINRIRGGTSEEAARDLSQKGIDVIVGEAAFVSPHELIAADKTFSAARIIIATGCQNVVPPIEGLDDVGFISNVEALALPALPNICTAFIMKTHHRVLRGVWCKTSS